MVWDGPAQGVRFESPYTNPVPVKERGDREKKAQLRDLAAGLREVRPRIFRHLKIRGRGECRVPNAPAASCALG